MVVAAQRRSRHDPCDGKSGGTVMTRVLATTGLALTGLACLAAQPADAQDKIRIGYVTTLSGPTAAIGNDMRNSVELALDHLGRKMAGKPVEIIYEDDQLKPDIGKQKTDKLVEQDRVPIVAGYIWSNVLIASYKAPADAGVFVLSSNAGPSQIAGAGCHKNFFNVSWQNDQTPMAMGETLNQRGVKSVYIMSPNYAAGRDMGAGVKRTYKGKVVGEDYTKWPGQLDFSAELSKVRASGADALFVFYPGAAGVQILNQYEQAGLKGKIPLYQVYTIDALSLPKQGDKALGVPGTQQWVNDLPNEANKRYVSDFLKKHNTYPSFYGSQAYDTITLIASAVEAVKGDMSKKDEFRAALKKADFKSVRGNFKFGNNHFPIQNFYLQETVKDAQGRLTLKTVSTVLTDHQDSHAAKCPMK
jgi:branched-chain amino acid transport system substrate-binding protein